MISVRRESTSDYDAVRSLIVEAFGGSELGHQGEADLVEQLRRGRAPYLSLVAVMRGEVVGHILFSRASIRTAEGELRGMGLGPMAVTPRYQRTGIGSLLVDAGLSQLSADRCPFVVVLGHPGYYPRFGFLPAAQFDLRHGFDGIDQTAFFIKLLESGEAHSIYGGVALYEPQFGPQRAD